MSKTVSPRHLDLHARTKVVCLKDRNDSGVFGCWPTFSDHLDRDWIPPAGALDERTVAPPRVRPASS
jgi:hypothetical protein